jgi:hypothetical protein
VTVAVKSASQDSVEFLAAEMANPNSQWSLGTFGGIAEFMRDRDEPVTLARNGNRLSAVTPRGGVRIVVRPDLRLFASESTTRESWAHRISLCLREDQCAMNQRRVLTELGPDTEALRDADRSGILFDLGIGALQSDLCVRIADMEVVTKLRPHVGRPLMEQGNPAMGIIFAYNPPRVFISKVGRVEVYQPIPPANGKSPEGPHTHVLPNLLAHQRTHAATEPVPDGYVPCAHLYPAHPVRDGLGNSLPFDAARHANFQDLLKNYGDPEFVALKQKVVAAVGAGDDPSVVTVTDKRFARANVRVTLRQLKAAQSESPSLKAWMAAHERPHEIEEEEEERHRHHR